LNEEPFVDGINLADLFPMTTLPRSWHGEAEMCGGEPLDGPHISPRELDFRSKKGLHMSSTAHLSEGPHTVALVSLGFGGTGIDYGCCLSHCTPYVNADDFERILQETNLLFGRSTGPVQFEGAYVVDKRPAIERHGSCCSVNSPMLNATLPEGGESPLRIERDRLTAMAPGLDGEFQSLAVKKLAQPEWRGLDFVCLTVYVDYWRGLGARIGRIRSRIVHWEDAAETS
jgi:hypothetical protein